MTETITPASFIIGYLNDEEITETRAYIAARLETILGREDSDRGNATLGECLIAANRAGDRELYDLLKSARNGTLEFVVSGIEEPNESNATAGPEGADGGTQEATESGDETESGVAEVAGS